jgi:uncharacterized membrane protein
METDKPDLEKQSLSVTIASLIGAALNGIVAYVAVYFFKPLWEKLIKWWKNEPNS